MLLPDGRSPRSNRLSSHLNGPGNEETGGGEGRSGETKPAAPADAGESDQRGTKRRGTEQRGTEQRAIDQRSGARQPVTCSVTQWTLRGTTFEEDLVACEKAGVDGLGLNMLKIDECGREKAIELLAHSTVRPTSLDWATNFTGFNRYSHDEACLEAIRLIRFAERVGCPTVTVVTGPQHSHMRNHCETLVVDALRQIADVADDHGVDLAVMPMGRYCGADWTFLHRLPETVRLLERVDSPRVGLLFHAFHLFGQPGLPQLLSQPETVGRIKLVRLSDWRRGCRHENDQVFPGEGALPLSAMLTHLQRAGFAGYHEVDVWSADTWRQDPAEVLAASRRFCEAHVPAPHSPTRSASAPRRVGLDAPLETVLRPA